MRPPAAAACSSPRRLAKASFSWIGPLAGFRGFEGVEGLEFRVRVLGVSGFRV